jgi:hypothetical protein
MSAFSIPSSFLLPPSSLSSPLSFTSSFFLPSSFLLSPLSPSSPPSFYRLPLYPPPYLYLLFLYPLFVASTVLSLPQFPSHSFYLLLLHPSPSSSLFLSSIHFASFHSSALSLPISSLPPFLHLFLPSSFFFTSLFPLCHFLVSTLSLLPCPLRLLPSNFCFRSTFLLSSTLPLLPCFLVPDILLSAKAVQGWMAWMEEEICRKNMESLMSSSKNVTKCFSYLLLSDGRSHLLVSGRLSDFQPNQLQARFSRAIRALHRFWPACAHRFSSPGWQSGGLNLLPPVCSTSCLLRAS